MFWSHNHVWWLRIGRDISAAEVPTEDGAIPVPHWAPQPGAPVKARGVLATAGCKNQQTQSGWDTTEAFGSGEQGDLSTGPRKDAYYIRPLCQNWEMWQTYLIHKN